MGKAFGISRETVYRYLRAAPALRRAEGQRPTPNLDRYELDRLVGQLRWTAGEAAKLGANRTSSANPSLVAPRYPTQFPLVEQGPETAAGRCAGNVHESWRQRGRMTNVGVDAWAGQPVDEETLCALIDAGPRDLPPQPWR